MKTRKIILYASIFFIFLILIFFFFIKNTNRQTTGQVIEDLQDKNSSTQQEISKGLEITCTDSDNGKVYSKKGVIKYCDSNGCSTKEDSCSGIILTERFCDGKDDYETHECESECDEGACINLVTEKKTTYTSGGGGGGSSSSSSGSSGTTVSNAQTYDLGTLGSENILEVFKGDNIKFNIGEDSFTLNIADNTQTQLSIVSASKTFILNVPEESNLDLNNDNVFDIYMKLKSINIINGKISLMLRPA